MNQPAVASQPPQRAHPSDLVALIIGRDHVLLPAIETPVAPTGWMLNGHTIPIITGGVNDGLEEIVARTRRKRLLHGVSMTVVALATFFTTLAITDGQAVIAGAPTKHAASAWKVVAIVDEGVAMDIDGRRVIFRVGDALPSGETLQDADAASGRFRTDRSVVTLRLSPALSPASAVTH